RRHTRSVSAFLLNRSSDLSFGGKTSYDADNRPLLVMRSNLWASGYDVDGTDQTSLGQFPEHGTMFTLALVRFPPTATKEIQYLRSEERRVGTEMRLVWFDV